jgi:hypothetical protein
MLFPALLNSTTGRLVGLAGWLAVYSLNGDVLENVEDILFFTPLGRNGERVKDAI